jgi:hypothetical protein
MFQRCTLGGQMGHAESSSYPVHVTGYACMAFVGGDVLRSLSGTDVGLSASDNKHAYAT